MDKFDLGTRHRTARWYEWLAVLVLLWLAFGVRAAVVYKCTGDAGDIAYQSTACIGGDQQEVALAPATSGASPPSYAIERPAPRVVQRAARPVQRRTRRPADMSYECRVADGEVFYRHTPCPRSIRAENISGVTRTRKPSVHAGQSLAVTSRAIPREEACAEIRRAGAIGRAGHERDETVSTYDRNLGRDPCG
ncbi:MAG TPA: hypothetical protein VFB32_00205 [Rudaea sp.]|jgi:hypothetical protein|nr:hypothetical protein [Rudaea sp.]